MSGIWQKLSDVLLKTKTYILHKAIQQKHPQRWNIIILNSLQSASIVGVVTEVE